jgi:hypothetical protein
MKDMEYDSPYIDSPVWPWSLAGCAIALALVLMALISWLVA